MKLDIIRQQRQFLISRAQTKLYRNTSQSVTYVLTTKKETNKFSVNILHAVINKYIIVRYVLIAFSGCGQTGE